MRSRQRGSSEHGGLERADPFESVVRAQEVIELGEPFVIDLAGNKNAERERALVEQAMRGLQIGGDRQVPGTGRQLLHPCTVGVLQPDAEQLPSTHSRAPKPFFLSIGPDDHWHRTRRPLCSFLSCVRALKAATHLVQHRGLKVALDASGRHPLILGAKTLSAHVATRGTWEKLPTLDDSQFEVCVSSRCHGASGARPRLGRRPIRLAQPATSA